MSRNEAFDATLTHGRFLVGTTPIPLFPDGGPHAATGNAFAGGGIMFHTPRSNDTEHVVYLGGPSVDADNGMPLRNGTFLSINLSRIGQLFAVANADGVDLRFMFM